MASEEFKTKCVGYLKSIPQFQAVYNPPGISTSILFADDADVCIIGTQYSNDMLRRPYGSDEILILRDNTDKSVTIAKGEFYSGDRMLPKAITPTGDHVTITIGSEEQTHNVTDLLVKPLVV